MAQVVEDNEKHLMRLGVSPSAIIIQYIAGHSPPSPFSVIFRSNQRRILWRERGGVGKCGKAVEVSMLYISDCECSKLGYVHICQ
jgi:hypothetical protein